MGVDFILFWSLVILITIWLTTLTHQFFEQKSSLDDHKQDFDDHKEHTHIRINNLEHTLDDVRTAIRWAEKKKD